MSTILSFHDHGVYSGKSKDLIPRFYEINLNILSYWGNLKRDDLNSVSKSKCISVCDFNQRTLVSFSTWHIKDLECIVKSIMDNTLIKSLMLIPAPLACYYGVGVERLRVINFDRCHLSCSYITEGLLQKYIVYPEMGVLNLCSELKLDISYLDTYDGFIYQTESVCHVDNGIGSLIIDYLVNKEIDSLFDVLNQLPDQAHDTSILCTGSGFDIEGAIDAINSHLGGNNNIVWHENPGVSAYIGLTLINALQDTTRTDIDHPGMGKVGKQDFNKYCINRECYTEYGAAIVHSLYPE